MGSTMIEYSALFSPPVKCPHIYQTHSQYLNGQVLLQGFVEAAGHTAVVCGVSEGCGTQDMVQQVAGQSVALLTAQTQGQL